MIDLSIRQRGAIYTPPPYAKLLTTWAIQTPNCNVLDVGVGEGVFAFAAYNRLLTLGQNPTDAQAQIYGSEIDATTFKQFSQLATDKGVMFPHITHSDFFETDFPQVQAVVGNPPYVRRMHINNVEAIRTTVFEQWPTMEANDFSRSSDLYIYFLLGAAAKLEVGGRLAVVTADSWLNVGYGRQFKSFLQTHFQLNHIISFDQPVFPNAEVKPLVLLATKQAPATTRESVTFMRVRNGASPQQIQNLVSNPTQNIPDVDCYRRRQADLLYTQLWNIYLRMPQLYTDIAINPRLTRVKEIAQTQIGLQTLAKSFFVLTADDVAESQLDDDFITPLAPSIKYYPGPTISPETESIFYLFYCNRSKEELVNTTALTYIEEMGENVDVKVRGKDEVVRGYHNKERIQRANRPYWYDLKTHLEKRGRATILVPRLIYQHYSVVWNQADFVPGEAFIEFRPIDSGIPLEVYLAVLSSSLTELMLRAHAQLYGGGTFNVSPGEIKKVPLVDVRQLSTRQKSALQQAYRAYIADGNRSRAGIDKLVYKYVGFSPAQVEAVREALADLVGLAEITE